jgi:hypothetical protein
MMTILRSIDGTFYDVPDSEAEGFKVPREKVKELLAKAGGPQPGPGAGGPGGAGHAPHGGPPPGAPVVINIFSGRPGGAPSGGSPSQEGGPGGDVDPYWYYWWWRNWSNWWNNY